MSVALLGCPVPLDHDYFVWRVKALAGPDATACGRVKPGQQASAAVACAMRAAKDGQPFWVIFDKYPHPIGSDVAAGLLRTSEGEFLMVIYTTDSPAIPGPGDPTLWQEQCSAFAPPLIRDVPIRCVPAA